MNSEIEVNSEPLPGYRLIKHLGAGGYGEVWSAEAPGGLTKAIKFVFGQKHEKRASHELRALERVRGVRHPFLLSLERIEVVNGRLLVVTELADGSVKDRFDECRRQDLPGIPREELIRYLCDAADALDFMISVHALGHLDIKPENLLLLANHVKVADFGLVKDVRQSQVSLVGGMTPLYAAPEVFRGLPGPQSDEYSLAVLYQEMLTGTLPFSGANAAQLTMQHLNDEPDLSSLPPCDRYAVSRALAKDAAHRFENCRQFVDALAKAVDESQLASPDKGYAAFGIRNVTPAQSQTPSPSCPTDVFDVDDTDVHALEASRMLIDPPAQPSQLVDLPPLALEGRSDEPLPTLVVGVGGAAGRVLVHLKSMLAEQFGSAALPAIQFLLLDTDSRSLAEASRHDGASLAPDETMTLPLQRPQHYREQSQQLLRWLSRRWLYNIPRSLRTEGLRPLGRLALTDHARQAGQRIRRGIIQAVDPDVLATSSRTLGTQFRSDAVQVFVVSSISGGTGGGMSLDLGYAMRAILQRLNLAQSKVIGLMLHATGGDARHCELARVNAFSWLTEFQHFERPDVAYPGDASCGFPPHDASARPFDETYLVHLGDHLDGDEFETAARGVADYLRLNTVTPARAFFDACREDRAGADENNSSSTNLRSFGVFRRTAAAGSMGDGFAAAVGSKVVEGWLGNSSAAAKRAQTSDSPGAQLVRRLRLDAEGIFANSRSLLELRLGADSSSFLTSWLAEQGIAKPTNDAPVFAAIDRIFAEAPADGDQDAGTLLGDSVSTIVGPLQEKLRADVRRWLVQRLDERQERLVGARAAVAWLTEHLTQTDSALRKFKRAAVQALPVAATDPNVPPSPPAAQSPHDYFKAKLDQLAARAAARTVRLLLSDCKSLTDELTALGREIEQIARNCASNLPPAPAAGEQEKLWGWLQPRLGQLAEDVDKLLIAECLREQGLWPTIMQGGRRRAQLTAKLQEFSRQTVKRFLGGVNVMNDLGGGEAASTLRSNLAAATPALLDMGGTRRVLAIVPQEGGPAGHTTALAKSLGLEVNTVLGIDNSMTLCVEAAGLPIEDVAIELVQRRRDRVEFAGRVQSRTDIEWTPLLPVASAAVANPWAEMGQSSEFGDQYNAKTMVI